MVYSTSRCPHCNNIVGKQTNPVNEIANPFEQCPYCGLIYRNTYKEEWITKSPLKRFLFFIGNGCLARAFIIPMVLVVIPIFGLVLYLIGFISWLVAGYFIHKSSNESQIKESLQRTQDENYLEILKKAGYKIYPVKDYTNNEENDKQGEE